MLDAGGRAIADHVFHYSSLKSIRKGIARTLTGNNSKVRASYFLKEILTSEEVQ